MKRMLIGSSVLIGQLLPVSAHEGTAGEHLLLGMDTGLAIGLVVGFLSGIAVVLFFAHRRNI